MASLKLLGALSICLSHTERLGLKVCALTLQRAFHKHGIWFYKLQEKLALTKDDIAERLAWLRVATFAKDLATKFHKHGRWFYKMKEKLALTKDDIVERLAWLLVTAFAKDLATMSL